MEGGGGKIGERGWGSQVIEGEIRRWKGRELQLSQGVGVESISRFELSNRYMSY